MFLVSHALRDRDGASCPRPENGVSRARAFEARFARETGVRRRVFVIDVRSFATARHAPVRRTGFPVRALRALSRLASLAKLALRNA